MGVYARGGANGVIWQFTNANCALVYLRLLGRLVCCQISVVHVQMEQRCVKPENVISHTCSYTVASCSSGYNGEASIRHDSSHNASIRRYDMHSAHYLFLSQTMF